MVSEAVAPTSYKGLRVKCAAWLWSPSNRYCNRVLAVQERTPKGIDPALTGYHIEGVPQRPYYKTSRPYIRSEFDGESLTIRCKCGAPWVVDFEALSRHQPLDESKVEGWVDVSTSEL